MFGWLKSAPFVEPALGELVRSRGLWRGVLNLPSGPVPLALAGNGKAPHADALLAAHEAVARFGEWQPAIAAALFEHYEGYRDAVEYTGNDVPGIAVADDVWKHVVLEFVAIAPLSFKLTTEFGLTTEWDEEHTVAARFVGGRMLELCGSVRLP